ncbi:cupin 2 barrel domain-containing protein [Natronococcus amylolyticus DSM 10524]|uniref:Cupin 2 barrel domain-containing protein n=1 Tax=Natronococcus amylolyticus DSM 10524 TaxID=1227497 RepID=L9X6A1_9EURY|nr:cupin domain-containing protein [Natronococcus amylolyticus]ELY56108.1 cupin 2 barrel domain-containing protein [Natronococcus amylolyticus DSM 10524]
METPDHDGAERTLETSFGERFALQDTAADTDGKLLRIETTLDPGVKRPLHSHPDQRERFVVHEGTLGLAVEDEEFVLEPGEETTVAAGTPHTFWNAGDGELRMTTEHRPALRFEEFLRAMVALDREGGLDAEGMPANPLVGAALLHEFRREMRPADVPTPVRRVAVPVLAAVASLFGYGVPDDSRSAAGSVASTRSP